MHRREVEITSDGIVDRDSHVPLKSNSFAFVNHHSPERFFKIRNRPYNLIKKRPSLREFSNAIYTPASRSTRPFDGCLYDEKLARINSSCIIRGRYDENFSMDSLHFEDDVNNLPSYDRSVLYLGYINPHYGHFLLESLSRWWVLSEGLSEYDNFLVHIHHPDVLKSPFVHACIGALKIDPQKILYFSKPVRIKNIAVPEASFQLESHIFSKYRNLCAKLVSNIPFDRSLKSDQPLYVSRRRLKSGVSQYKGEDKIEDYLTKQGAYIIHPQLIPFREQVQLFNKHNNIIGIAGSAMHNMVLAENSKKALYITPHWINPNCFLIDKCFNANSTYIQSCSNVDWILFQIRRVVNRLNIRWVNASHDFRRSYHLDSANVIKWLKDTYFS